MKTIILTGGGTAGHVTPNIALIPTLQNEGWDINYIGTENGIEKELISKEGIKYYAISSGKLRRYFSMKNFTDIFRVMSGVMEATKIIHKIKPDVIFSKGGFVAVPVVIGAKLNNIPIIAHESDITPGLANKIAVPFAEKVCTTFPETIEYIPKGKGINTGTPIRAELFKGDKQKGISLCGFNTGKPVIMMMGGSLGSIKINTVLRNSLNIILKDYQLVHLCGKGNIDRAYETLEGYKQIEYVTDELKDIFAAADMIISRAGSNSISEFLALKKPCLLIPLSANASRGDQILNAESFEKQGFAVVLQEEEMNEESLCKSIKKLYDKKDDIISSMEKSSVSDGVEMVMKQIRRAIEKKTKD